MKLTYIPFGTTDWSSVESVAHLGPSGTAYWRISQLEQSEFVA